MYSTARLKMKLVSNTEHPANPKTRYRQSNKDNPNPNANLHPNLYLEAQVGRRQAHPQPSVVCGTARLRPAPRLPKYRHCGSATLLLIVQTWFGMGCGIRKPATPLPLRPNSWWELLARYLSPPGYAPEAVKSTGIGTIIRMKDQ